MFPLDKIVNLVLVPKFGGHGVEWGLACEIERWGTTGLEPRNQVSSSQIGSFTAKLLRTFNTLTCTGSSKTGLLYTESPTFVGPLVNFVSTGLGHQVPGHLAKHYSGCVCEVDHRLCRGSEDRTCRHRKQVFPRAVLHREAPVGGARLLLHGALLCCS